MTIGSISSTTPLIAGDANFSANLSPDALMVYVQTRLNGLDEQVNTIFNDQKRQQEAQEILRDINELISKLDDKAGKDAGRIEKETPASPPPVANSTIHYAQSTTVKPTSKTPAADPSAPTVDSFLKEFDDKIEQLSALDPSLAAKIKTTLEGEGQVLSFRDNKYSGPEVTASRDFLAGIGKDLESQAALNMIRLQSIMSSRQTAVQLATNMVSSLGETTKSIVANVGH